MAVTAIFKEQSSELHRHYEQRVRRVVLAQRLIKDVEHLCPVHQVGLFVGPRPIQINHMLQAFAQFLGLTTQSIYLLLHLHQSLRLRPNTQ